MSFATCPTPHPQTPEAMFECLIARWRRGVDAGRATGDPAGSISAAAQDVLNATRMRDGLTKFGVDLDDPAQLRAVICTLDGACQGFGQIQPLTTEIMFAIGALIGAAVELYDEATASP